MATRVTIHQDELNRLLRSPAGEVWRHVEDITRRTTNQAKTTAPVDEGTYRASISETVSLEGTRIRGRVGSPVHYAIHIELGTGVYGPRGAPITPKSGKYLVFPGRGGGTVFATSVRGMRAYHTLENALRASAPYPVRRLI